MAFEVVFAIVGKIGECLIEPIGRQLGYLVHYKQNVKKLEDEDGKLKNTRRGVQKKIDTAKTNGESIEDDVNEWLEKVRSGTQEVEELLKDKDKSCFKGWCPDIWSHYRLGKEAKKKAQGVVGLREDGEKFETVSNPLPPPDIGSTSTADYEAFGSRTLVFEEIMKTLKDDKVNIIGLYGMGGVGKTTMAEEVGKRVKNDNLFDDVVMVVISQNPNVGKIQGELACRLSLELNEKTELGGANRLCHRLKNGKRNLVILDDVWKDLDLKEIGIPLRHNNIGCKILLTSRDESVWPTMDIQNKFPIGVLSKGEAWDLFIKTVGNSFDTSEMHSIAEEVCEECGGLPIAIVTVGAALKNKGKPVWSDALAQLRNSILKNIKGMYAKVNSSLELSYNFLETEDAKSCFLLCCLFPEDADISVDDLVRYGKGMELFEDALEKAKDRVCTLVDILKSSYLLLNGSDEEHVKMHDVIRDVAISIASKGEHVFLVKSGLEEWLENNTFEYYTVISLSFMHAIELPKRLECPKLHTFVLKSSSTSLEITGTFFGGMKELKVLDLTHCSLPSLPSLVCFLANLRTLRLNHCVCRDISVLGELKKLEILHIHASSLKELPREIGKLIGLRLLDLRKCKMLKRITSHVISSLFRLEELYLPSCFGQWEIGDFEGRSNASLVELKSLSRLKTLEIHIPDVTVLPEDLPFGNLTKFKISVGSFFGWNEENNRSTRILKLANIPLINEGVDVLLKRAEVLYLSGLNGFKNVLHNRDGMGFLDLKHLEVRNCLIDQQEWVSQNHGSESFCKLSVLIVKNCGLKYLFTPSLAGSLEQLQRLKIEGCQIMEEIVEKKKDFEREIMEDQDVLVFPQLKNLKLKELPNLTSFYPKVKQTSASEALFNEKVAFPALEELLIDGLENVRKIWHDQLLPDESFCQLRILRVSRCGRFKNIFSHYTARGLVHLRSLTIDSCEMMEEIVATEKAQVIDKIVFPQLHDLYLSNLQNLKSFCTSGGTTTLEEELPQHLFNDKVAFPCLEVLQIKGIDNMVEIWHGHLPIESFCKLRKLEVIECGKVLNVMTSTSLQNFGNLQRLIVDGCCSLEEVFKLEGPNVGDEIVARDKLLGKEATTNLVLHQLMYVELEKLPHMTSFGSESCIFELPSLVTLRIKGCPKLETFPCRSLTSQKLKTIGGPIQPFFDEKVAFPTLEELYILNCERLKNIFSHYTARSLVHLRSLTIDSCEMMEEIVATEKAQVIDKIVFPQLQFLKLLIMPNLKSFCTSGGTTTTLEEELPQHLFNDKVAFPCLEVLEIKGIDNMVEIWHGHLPTESFCKLVGKEATINPVLHQLKFVVLENLPHMTNFGSGSCIFELSSLRAFQIEGCPKLETFPCQRETIDVRIQPFIYPSRSAFMHSYRQQRKWQWERERERERERGW